MKGNDIAMQACFGYVQQSLSLVFITFYRIVFIHLFWVIHFMMEPNFHSILVSRRGFTRPQNNISESRRAEATRHDLVVSNIELSLQTLPRNLNYKKTIIYSSFLRLIFSNYNSKNYAKAGLVMCILNFLSRYALKPIPAL